MGQTPFDQLPLNHLMGEDADRIEKQYEKIFLQPWKTEEVFCDELQLPKDSIVFWGKVVQCSSGTAVTIVPTESCPCMPWPVCRHHPAMLSLNASSAKLLQSNQSTGTGCP